MTDQKPTGVFVRLPLSDEQKSKIFEATSFLTPLDTVFASLGIPVQADELPVVTTLGTLRDPIPCVRQSEAQAQIAARDAEIGRLRDENEALKDLAKAGRDSLKYCSTVVKGGAA